MHIYAWQIDPPSQSSIDALHTATPDLLPQRVFYAKDLLPARVAMSFIAYREK